MKMCLKLAHCAFSSSPSKDVTMSTFCGFSSLFVEVCVSFSKDGRMGRFRDFSSLFVEA